MDRISCFFVSIKNVIFSLTWIETVVSLFLLRSVELILKLIFFVREIDEEMPEIIGCPEHVWNVTEPGEETGIALWTPPTADDNSGMVTLTCSHRPGDSFPIGITKVNYSAVDAAGNEADVCCFNVTIKGT